MALSGLKRWWNGDDGESVILKLKTKLKMDRMSQPIYLVSLYNEIMVVATKVMMVAVVEW